MIAAIRKLLASWSANTSAVGRVSDIDALQSTLKQRYKVDFSSAQETIENQRVVKNGEWGRYGPMIKARPPRIEELQAIEAALAKAEPSQLIGDGTKGVKFYFLNLPVNPEFNDDEAMFVHQDKNGRPAVYIMPGLEDLPATESVRSKDDVASTNLPRSLQATLVHELAHNTQSVLGWNTSKDDRLPTEGNGFGTYEFDRKVASDLGLAYLKNQADGSPEWLRKDRYGNLYHYHQVGTDTHSNQWRRCNAKGGFLTKDGQPARKMDDVETLTNQQMALKSLVAPITDYFPNPQETLAESLQWLRLDTLWRAQLFLRRPELYSVTKNCDQLEINKRLGTQNGAPKVIRSVRGTLVPATPENVNAISSFERDLSNIGKGK